MEFKANKTADFGVRNCFFSLLFFRAYVPIISRRGNKSPGLFLCIDFCYLINIIAHIIYEITNTFAFRYSIEIITPSGNEIKLIYSQKAF